jgi:hypothetical protein
MGSFGFQDFGPSAPLLFSFKVTLLSVQQYLSGNIGFSLFLFISDIDHQHIHLVPLFLDADVLFLFVLIPSPRTYYSIIRQSSSQNMVRACSVLSIGFLLLRSWLSNLFKPFGNVRESFHHLYRDSGHNNQGASCFMQQARPI